MKLKDYCSYFPEEVQNQEIGQSCCKHHDHDVTRTFNLITPHIKFYRCLRSHNITWTLATVIAIGGAILTYIKYPYFAIRLYFNRGR